LGGITRTVKKSWYGSITYGAKLEIDMKTTLHQVYASTLNIYVPGEVFIDFHDPVLGWATFPSEYNKNSLNDGVVIREHLHHSIKGLPRSMRLGTGSFIIYLKVIAKKWMLW
jgi:hypothetical protein